MKKVTISPVEPTQPLKPLLQIARDLTAGLGSENRYQRLLDATRDLVPYDAACLLRFEDNLLIPLAGVGLKESALKGQYHPDHHPRLKAIIESHLPVSFPGDSKLPDPFDGQVIGLDALPIHACIGLPLRDGHQLVGALTADAINPGAFDHLDPTLLETLAALAGAALKTSSLIESVERLANHREEVVRNVMEDRVARTGDLVGSSVGHQSMVQQINTVAKTDLPVLVTGETGVGKELVAQLVHRNSTRSGEPFIEVNCGALPENLAESEFFGHSSGAFTGAVKARAGKFEVADGGTIFLDEIGELPLSLQASLLRVLQSGEVQRVGSDTPHRVDVRLVAATNRNLEKEVAEGRFRSDLFHRLAGFPIEIPPLRKRREDIPLLTHHFAEKARKKFNLVSVRISDEALDTLTRAPWPGNVREIGNVIQRATLMASTQSPGDVTELKAEHLGLQSQQHHSFPSSFGLIPTHGNLKDRLEAFKRHLVLESIQEHPENMAAAARSLGLHRSNFHQLCQRLNIS